jgi:hypothetical protein
MKIIQMFKNGIKFESKFMTDGIYDLYNKQNRKPSLTRELHFTFIDLLL